MPKGNRNLYTLVPFHVVFTSIYLNFYFWRERNGIEATLRFCVIPAIAPFKFVYVTMGNPAFSLTFCFTVVHFRGKLQQVDHVGEQRLKCQPIRTREIARVRLYKELYVMLSKLRLGEGEFSFLHN